MYQCNSDNRLYFFTITMMFNGELVHVLGRTYSGNRTSCSTIFHC